jgi:hypothetical protein
MEDRMLKALSAFVFSLSSLAAIPASAETAIEVFKIELLAPEVVCIGPPLPQTTVSEVRGHHYIVSAYSC